MPKNVDNLATLRRRVAKAPESPGVYRWKNAEGEVMYVGKAKNLRNRLRSYVQKNADKAAGPWRRSFYQQLADFDATVTNTELEALVLETNLIKQLRPKYNVLMKDDKHYVYVELRLDDPYPYVQTERKMLDPKAKYFGPFLSAWETRQTLDMLNEIFCFRACKQSIDALNRADGDAEAVYGTGKLKPCLDYQIGQCCGTCAGVVSQEEYRSRIAQVAHFFKGDYKPVLEKGRELMMKAAADKKFERAAKLRDMLGIIESLQERQLVSDTSGENVDVIGLALLAGKVHVVVFHKRSGKLIGEQQFALMGAAESIAEVLEQFLPQYYEDVADVPDAVIVGEDFPSKTAFEEFLSDRRGKKVKVIIPERGNKSQLLQLAETNAHEKAKQAEASWEADKRNTESALADLTQLLELPAEPKRIEGYDISHTAGTETVGSMVVCVNGKPKNDHYRSFTIHTMQTGVVDDYRALREVLSRRLRHFSDTLKKEEEMWAASDVTVEKPKKADMPVIKELIEANNMVSHGAIECEYLIAKEGSTPVGLLRFCEFKGKAIFLYEPWLRSDMRERTLGEFMYKKFLHQQKDGKVYISILPSQEEAFARMGFRYVIDAPDALMQFNAEGNMFMMYDVKRNKPDVSFLSKPDLIVIDGGKGQLGVGVEVLKQFGLDIPVIGLAKREEEVFVPGKSVSVLFPHDSSAKFLLMRLRDEAHRFANAHRKKRAFTTAIKSKLDSVPSIGLETKQALLAKFGSVDAIRTAGDEALRSLLSDSQIQQLRTVL